MTWKLSQIDQNLPNFNKLFISANFTDDFGWCPEWNAEIEKWLGFVVRKDSNFYKKNENRAQSDKQRDELLGEYRAAYFIGSKCSGKNSKFEPNGKENKKLDFSFEDKNGDLWFAEVKSPSWRNEVAKEVKREYLNKIRSDGIQMRIDPKTSKYIGSIKCPNCNSSIDYDLEIANYQIEGITDERLKKTVCQDCNKNIWKISENERAQKINERLAKPQFRNSEWRWFNGDEAIEDAIRKSTEQFEEGKNNLLIITPNMFMDAGFLPAMDEGHGVRKLLSKYDTKKVISCILILEVSLPAESGNVKYTDVWVPVKNKRPKL